MVLLDPGAVEVGVVIFNDPVGLTEEETGRPVRAPEETVEFGGADCEVTLPEREGVVAVLLGESGTLILDEAIPLEVGEVSSVTVVVISREAVPEIVPSL